MADSPYDRLRKKHARGYGGLDSRDLPTEYEIKLKRKRGHFWFALHSGLIWHQDDDIRFLTLTSPVNPAYLPASFHRLTSALHREKIRFDYINLRTAEGNGVLHIVATGDFIPVEWIREVWNRVHGVYSGYDGNVQFNIKLVSNTRGLAGYLLRQYLKSQEGFIRYSLSRGWLWQGYRRDWKEMIETHGFEEAKVLWRKMLERHEARVLSQTSL